jgi:hypothetical protein
MVQIDLITSRDCVDLRKIMLTEFEAETFLGCVHLSQTIHQARIDGEIACIWGLAPPTVMSTQAYIWLYTTAIAEEHTFIVVRYSQMMIQEMLKDYNAITGHCRIDDERAIRWMRWLGAEFSSPQGKLVPFVIRRKNELS